MYRLLFITFLVIYSFAIHAQDKYEKEIRLKSELVPQQATDFIDALSFSKKVRWYKEFGLNYTSIEAKTKHLGTRYSIEFSSEGILEDAELRIGIEEIRSDTRQKITNYLGAKYKKYTINKIQIQYSGEEIMVLECLKTNNDQLSITTKYELVISTKVKGTYKSYEYLFSKEGDFIQSAKIVKKNTVNIEF